MAKREGKWQRDGGRKGTRSSRSSQELPFGPREPFVSRFMRDASLSAPMAFVLIKIHWAPRPTRPPSSSSFYTNINPNTASNSIPQSNFLPGFFQQRPFKKKTGEEPVETLRVFVYGPQLFALASTSRSSTCYFTFSPWKHSGWQLSRDSRGKKTFIRYCWMWQSHRILASWIPQWLVDILFCCPFLASATQKTTTATGQFKNRIAAAPLFSPHNHLFDSYSSSYIHGFFFFSFLVFLRCRNGDGQGTRATSFVRVGNYCWRCVSLSLGQNKSTRFSPPWHILLLFVVSSSCGDTPEWINRESLNREREPNWSYSARAAAKRERESMSFD